MNKIILNEINHLKEGYLSPAMKKSKLSLADIDALIAILHGFKNVFITTQLNNYLNLLNIETYLDQGFYKIKNTF